MATAPLPEKKKMLVVIPVKEMNKKDKEPRPSLSSIEAFEWTVTNIIRSDKDAYMIHFFHVYYRDDDNLFTLANLRTDLCIHSRYTVSPEDFLKNFPRGIKLLDRLMKRCSEMGIACEFEVRSGEPQVVICDHVTRIEADLLVVGSRDRDAFQKYARWWYCLPDVGKYCTEHAECPVIIAKHRAKRTPCNPVQADSLASRLKNLAV